MLAATRRYEVPALREERRLLARARIPAPILQSGPDHVRPEQPGGRLEVSSEPSGHAPAGCRQSARGRPRGLAPGAFREFVGSAAVLVAYLLEGASRTPREPFLRYYRLEREPGPCPPEELERQLGVALDDLEKEWLAFLQGIVR